LIEARDSDDDNGGNDGDDSDGCAQARNEE
jgi:hypothetical protein